MKLLYYCVAQAIILLFALDFATAQDTEITNAPAPAQPDPVLAARTAQNCANDASLPGNVLQIPVFYYASITPEENGWQPTADDWTWKSMMVGSKYHTLVQFNVDDIPQDIDLRVVCASIDFEQTSSPTPLELHQITMPWTTKATWEYANNPTDPWNNPGGDYELNSLSSFEDGVHAQSTISLVASVQRIVDGSEENFGFLLRARSTGDDAIELTNPRLYIRYVSSGWTAPSTIAYIPGTSTKPPDPVPWVQPVPKPSPIPRPNPSPVFFSSSDDDEQIIDSNQGRHNIAMVGFFVGLAVIGLIFIIVQLIVNKQYERNEIVEDAEKVVPLEEEEQEQVPENNFDTENDESFSDALSDKPVV